MNIKLAFSTCPNDTFMFEALVNKRIDTGKYEFEINLADIEELNQQAAAGVNHVTKISFNAFSQLTREYQILRSGAAIGFGNGPLIISKHKIYPDELHHAKVAIPGEQTTANLLLKILYPGVQQKKNYLFSDIEEAVLSGEADAGLIIHETRFSYHKRGLQKVVDLGEKWESAMQLPLPLGGIAIKRELPDADKQAIEKLVAQSVQFAIDNPKASEAFVRQHARDLDNAVIQQHIDLYVNQFSIDCRDEGFNAISKLTEKAAALHQKTLFCPVFATLTQ